MSAVTRLVNLMAACGRHGVKSLVLARRAIHRFQAAQRTTELMGLIAAVRDLRPKTIVEIGSKLGGTLYCWAQVADPQALLVSVDLPGGDFGGGCSEEHARTFHAFLRSGQRLECVRGDSHDPAVFDRVRRLVGGPAADFLFIDGDHTYAGVKQDFDRYTALVRPGGLIAFHDILPYPPEPNNQVHRFWKDLKGRYPVQEIIDGRNSAAFGMGIGLLRQPAAGATT
jgi:predicted O-methyltransferase YrrM